MNAESIINEKSDRRSMRAMRTLTEHDRTLCDSMAVESAANLILHDIDCMLAAVTVGNAFKDDQGLNRYTCDIESWGIDVTSQRYHGKRITLQVTCENYLVKCWID